MFAHAAECKDPNVRTLVVQRIYVHVVYGGWGAGELDEFRLLHGWGLAGRRVGARAEGVCSTCSYI